MRLSLALFAALLLVTPAGAQRVERNTDAMGATFSVILYGSDQASMNQAIDAAFDEAHRLDELPLCPTAQTGHIRGQVRSKADAPWTHPCRKVVGGHRAPLSGADYAVRNRWQWRMGRMARQQPGLIELRTFRSHELWRVAVTTPAELRQALPPT